MPSECDEYRLGKDLSTSHYLALSFGLEYKEKVRQRRQLPK